MVMIILNEVERNEIKELLKEEQTCIEKYHRYKKQALDPELKDLFAELEKKEQKHYDSLQQVLRGEVAKVDCNDTSGRDYKPVGTYDKDEDSENKRSDCFLAVDGIGTEKMVSGDYNSRIFAFSQSEIRSLLADIQVEEQNHAEMMYKYRMANGMIAN